LEIGNPKGNREGQALNLWRYYPFPEGVGGVDRRVRAWEGTALSVKRGRVVGKGS